MSEENTITLTMQEVLQRRTELNSMIERKECLERLMHNQDFRKVFLDNYCDKEPARLVHLLAEPAIVMSPDRDIRINDIREQMLGISRFSSYMRNIFTMAEHAQYELEKLNQADIIS